MDIYIWNFGKKTSSTAVPSLTEGATHIENVYLKNPCTMRNPVFALRGIPNFNGNYVYVPMWKKYYYVDNIEFTNNDIVTLNCSIDVLATYRNEIFATNAYITRSSVKRDSSISDSFYVTKTGKHYLENNFQFVDPSLPYSYVLGVVGKKQGVASSITGAVQYVIMSLDNILNLMTFLFTPENFSDEIVDNVVKTFFNPMQYISECIAYPFQIPTSSEAELSLGWFTPTREGDYAITCSPVIGAHFDISSQTIAIPRPISGDKADYRNYSPYTSYRMYIPFAGWVQIDSSLLKNDNNLKISGLLDIPTGALMMKITGAESGNIITTLECNAGIHIPIAQSTILSNNIGTVAGTVGGVSSAISKFTNFIADITNDNEAGRYFAEKMRGLGSGADSVADAAGQVASGQISTKGDLGNMSERVFEPNVRLVCEYFESVSMDNGDFGSPYCVAESLSQHVGGLVVCSNPHFICANATKEDIAQVESYMTGGIYLE